MSLIDCKECGKQVSDKATTCPTCGVSLEASSVEVNVDNVKSDADKTGENSWLNIILFAIFIIGILMMKACKSILTSM
jgi:uncharacterized membrane protein YvbJ